MTLQELHDKTKALLAAGVNGRANVALTSDASDWLESLEGDLVVVTTKEGTTYAVLDQGDAYSTATCYAYQRSPGVYTEEF